MFKIPSLNHKSLRISQILSLAIMSCLLSTPGFTAPSLTLANTNNLLTSLINLADAQDLYNQFGVQLELLTKDSSEAALRSLIEHRADIAVVDVTPFVRYAFKHPNLRSIASIGESDNHIRIAARKDRNISTPKDLRGKLIGTQPGGDVHLFLNRLLAKTGMSEQDITSVYMPAGRLPAALANGLVDAICSPEPTIDQAMAKQPEGLRIISTPGIYVKNFNLVTTSEFLQTDRAKALIPLLQALHEAEIRLTQHPEEMTALLSKQLGQSPDRVRQQLDEVRIRLTMDQELLASLETIAHWLGSAQDSADGKSIDFLSYLHTPLLATVKPQGVSLSR